MITKTITYTDYNGNERTEDFRFNLTEKELTKMQLSTAGGMDERIKQIIEKQDGASIMNVLDDLICMAYGEKTLDGRGFRKSEELTEDFKSTEAYSILFMELVTNDEKASEFVNGIMPKSVSDEMKKLSVVPAATN